MAKLLWKSFRDKEHVVRMMPRLVRKISGSGNLLPGRRKRKKKLARNVRSLQILSLNALHVIREIATIAIWSGTCEPVLRGGTKSGAESFTPVSDTSEHGNTTDRPSHSPDLTSEVVIGVRASEAVN